MTMNLEHLITVSNGEATGPIAWDEIQSINLLGLPILKDMFR